MDILGKAASSVRRIRAWLRRARHDEDLRTEIAQHIELRQQQLIDDGMDPREAAWEARRMFGNALTRREEARDLRSIGWVDAFTQDARFGLRLLLRTPSFAIVTVLSLGVPIAAAVAVFTIADAVLYRPLPVRNPGELRAFHVDVNFGGGIKTVSGVPEDAVAAIQAGADFAEFIGFRTSDDVAFGRDGDPDGRMIRVEFVTANYFAVLGVPIRAGRGLDLSDRRADPIPVVVSERLWGAVAPRDGAIGRPVSLNGQPARIVGVMQRFTGMNAERPADVIAPLAAGALVDPTQTNFIVQLVARLQPGVAVAVAEERLASLYRITMPGGGGGQAQVRASLREAFNGIAGTRQGLERPLQLSLVLAGILVLVACANAGALLLARFAARRGEFGIRVAIGAGRARLARQLAVEASIVALAAASVGLLCGYATAPLLMHAMPDMGSQVAFELRFDHRLVFFTAIMAFVCAMGAAGPLLARVWRIGPGPLLARESRAVISGSRRITRVLIGMQVACSLVLLVGAVSMLRTVANLKSVPLGFDHTRLLAVTVNAAGLRPPSEMSALHRALHERLARIPAVERATMAQLGVLTSSSTIGSVTIAGFTPSTDQDRISQMYFVGPEYMETLGVPVLAGRSLGLQDFGPRTSAAVVNERFAEFYFGSVAAAVDRIVNRDVRIVGVVADAHFSTPRNEPGRAMFVPYIPLQRSSMAHMVRFRGDPAAIIPEVRKAVHAHDPRLRPRIATADHLFDTALARERFLAGVAWALSAVALVLAGAGLYAAVAYAVSQRSGEIAVRIALGASARSVGLLVVRDPLRTTVAGILAGLPGTWLLMRSVSALLFDVSPFDAVTVTACAAALVAFALAAAARPALRATGIDPIAALRST